MYSIRCHITGILNKLLPRCIVEVKSTQSIVWYVPVQFDFFRVLSLDKRGAQAELNILVQQKNLCRQEWGVICRREQQELNKREQLEHEKHGKLVRQPIHRKALQRIHKWESEERHRQEQMGLCTLVQRGHCRPDEPNKSTMACIQGI